MSDPKRTRRNRQNRSALRGAAPALLDACGVAVYLSIPRRSVYRLAAAGRIPRPIRLGASLRWIRAQLDEWVAQGCPTQTANGGGGE